MALRSATSVLRPVGEAGSVAPRFLLDWGSAPMSHDVIIQLLDEAIVALLSMLALLAIPNRKPPIIFLVVFAAGALFHFVLRRFLHQV